MVTISEKFNGNFCQTLLFAGTALVAHSGLGLCAYRYLNARWALIGALPGAALAAAACIYDLKFIKWHLEPLEGLEGSAEVHIDDQLVTIDDIRNLLRPWSQSSSRALGRVQTQFAAWDLTPILGLAIYGLGRYVGAGWIRCISASALGFISGVYAVTFPTLLILAMRAEAPISPEAFCEFEHKFKEIHPQLDELCEQEVH